jgi:hypothetical protein
MTGVQIQNGRQQFIDINGDPLVAGTVGMYVVGTLTPKNTWQDYYLEVLNTNPIVLDSRGQATIWGNGLYRQILKDALGNTIWDKIVQGAPNPYPYIVTPQMFGAKGDLVADDTDAIQEAIDTGYSVLFSTAAGGGFLTDGGHHIETNGQQLFGKGLVKKAAGTAQSVFFVDDQVEDVLFDIRIDGNMAAFVGGNAGSCIEAYRAINLQVYGELFNFIDDGVKAYNCPNIYVDESAYIHDGYNTGVELRSYSYDTRTGLPWVGDYYGPSGTVYGTYERINDSLSGAGNGTGVDFSAIDNGASRAPIGATGGFITMGTPDLTCTGITFVVGDIGKRITIYGAGVGGIALTAAISAYVGPNAVTINTNASTTAAGTITVMYTGLLKPVSGLRVGGRFRDNIRGIWSENNDFGGQAENIVIDTPFLEGNISGTIENYLGIGFVGVKSSNIIGANIRNIGNFSPVGGVSAGILISESVGVAPTERITLTAPNILDNTNGVTRTEYGIYITAGNTIQVFGDSITGTRTMDFYVSTTNTTNVTRESNAGYTVASLPPAASMARAKLSVTDSNATLTAGIGAVVAGGGANVVPVFSDGTNWLIG